MIWQPKVSASSSGFLSLRRLLAYVFYLAIIFTPTCKPEQEKVDQAQGITLSQAQKEEISSYRSAYASFFSQHVRTFDSSHQDLVIINNTPPAEFWNMPVIVSEGMAYLKRMFVLTGDKENFIKASQTFEKLMGLKDKYPGLHRWAIQENGQAFESSRYEEPASDAELDNAVADIQAQKRFGADANWEPLHPQIIKNLKSISEHLIDRRGGLNILKPFGNDEFEGLINPGYVGIDDLDQIVAYLREQKENKLADDFQKVRDRHYQILIQFFENKNIHYERKGIVSDWCIVKIEKGEIHLYSAQHLENRSPHQGLEALRILWRSIDFVPKHPQDALSQHLLKTYATKFELFDSAGDSTRMSSVDYMLKALHGEPLERNLIANAFDDNYFDTSLKALIVFREFSRITAQNMTQAALKTNAPGFLPIRLYWSIDDRQVYSVNTSEIDDNSFKVWQKNPENHLAYYMYSNSLLAAGDYRQAQKYFRGLIEKLSEKDFSKTGLLPEEYNLFENAIGQYMVLFVLQGRTDKLIGEFSQMAGSGQSHWMIELYLAQLRLLSDYGPEWQKAIQNLKNVDYKSFPYFYESDFRDQAALEQLQDRLIRDGLLRKKLPKFQALKSINAHLENPDFYGTWKKTFSGKLLNFELEKQLAEIEILRNEVFEDLPMEQKRKVVSFNRGLLVLAYQDLCPESYRKPIEGINRNHFGLKQNKYLLILKTRLGAPLAEKDLLGLGNSIPELESKARGYHYLARIAKSQNDREAAIKHYEKALQNYSQTIAREREWSSSYWSLADMLPSQFLGNEEYLRREPERSLYLFKQEKLDLIKEWLMALQEQPYQIESQGTLKISDARVLKELALVAGIRYDDSRQKLVITENFNETHLELFKRNEVLKPYAAAVAGMYLRSFQHTPKALAHGILDRALNRSAGDYELSSGQKTDLGHVMDILSRETRLDASTLKKFSANLLLLQMDRHKNDGRYELMWQEALILDDKYKRTALLDFERRPMLLPDIELTRSGNRFMFSLPFDGERERVYLYENQKRIIGLISKKGTPEERQAYYLRWMFWQYKAMLQSRPHFGKISWEEFIKLAGAEKLSFEMKDPGMRQFYDRMENATAQKDLAKMYEIDIQKFYWAITDILNATTLDVAENARVYAEILETLERTNAVIMQNQRYGHLFNTLAINIAIKKVELAKSRAKLKELELYRDKKIEAPRDIFIPGEDRTRIQDQFHRSMDLVLELKDYQQLFSLYIEYYNFQLNGNAPIPGNRIAAYQKVLQQAKAEDHLKLTPFQEDLLQYLKAAALAQANQNSQALALLLPLDQKIVVITPGDEMPGWIWMNIARVYLRQGNHQKVREYLDKVVRNYPRVKDQGNFGNLASEYVDIQRYLNVKPRVMGDLFHMLMKEK